MNAGRLTDFASLLSFPSTRIINTRMTFIIIDLSDVSCVDGKCPCGQIVEVLYLSFPSLQVIKAAWERHLPKWQKVPF